MKLSFEASLVSFNASPFNHAINKFANIFINLTLQILELSNTSLDI